MTNKFNILYEEIMNKINNYSEVHTTILKVYNWNIKDNDFTDLDKEILNFKFKEGGKAESEILEDLTYDFDQCEEHNLEDGVYRKVEFIDKYSNDIILSYITDIDHLNETIELFKYKPYNNNNNFEDLYDFDS